MADDLLPGSGPRSRGRRALGRGLDALLPAGEQHSLQQVDVDRIDPNPNQPRQRFEHGALEELATSIGEHGILQPLLVSRQDGDRYRLIVGERRWQAARLAGLRQVPVVIKDASDRQTLELALIENVQRSDLNPLEEAAAYQRLIEDFGLTQAQVARQAGKSRVAVANTLRLLAASETLKRAVVEGRISEGHARALLGLADLVLQSAALERVEREGLNVRQTEELVRRLSSSRKVSAPTRSATDPDIEALADRLARSLGTKVTLHPNKRGGRVVIEWYSNDEFDTLYQRLLQAGS